MNLQALQLLNPRGVASIEAVLTDSEIEADRVMLEVTESVLTSDIEGASRPLTR